jgi:PAS fold.
MALDNLFNRIKLKESSTLPEKDQWYLENRRHAQEMMKTGSWTYEIGNDTVYFTDEYYRIFETAPDQLGENAESYFQYVSKEDVSKVKNSRELAFLGKDQELEYQIITGQGNEKFVKEKTRTLVDEMGKPKKIIGALQDITSEKIIENSLKELGENLNLGQKVAGLAVGNTMR